MFVIEKGSPAFEALRILMADDATTKVSFEERSDGVALKRNEACWTPTLHEGVTVR